MLLLLCAECLYGKDVEEGEAEDVKEDERRKSCSVMCTDGV